MMRSANTSAPLTLEDAIAVWRLRRQGIAQHRIAAQFDVNPGRISEVLTGRRFPEAKTLSEREG